MEGATCQSSEEERLPRKLGRGRPLLTNREELSFFTVLAFPKASRIGLACSSCRSSSPWKGTQRCSEDQAMAWAAKPAPSGRGESGRAMSTCPTGLEQRLLVALHASLGLVPVSLKSNLPARPPVTSTGLNVVPWTDRPAVLSKKGKVQLTQLREPGTRTPDQQGGCVGDSM